VFYSSFAYDSIQHRIDLVTSHHIHLLPVALLSRSTNHIPIHLPHVSHSTHLLNLDIVQLVQVLPYLWLREGLICLEYQHVVVYFFARTVQDYFFLEKFVLRVLFWKIAVSRCLSICIDTSRP